MIEEPVKFIENKTDWLPVWSLIAIIAFIVFLALGLVKIIPLKLSIAIIFFVIATANFLTVFFLYKENPKKVM